MQKNLFGVVAVTMMFLGAGCHPRTIVSPSEQQKPTSVDADSGKETDATMKREKAEYEKTQADSSQGQEARAGSYKNYSAETVVAEQQLGQKVVLFFYAPWCPYCRAAEKAFLADTNKIPAGVTVLKLDYDTQTALKEKYGVNYQHTFVQIDASGNMVAKWVSGDVDNLVKNIK